MDLSDDIAYSVHDVEDGVVGGWFSLQADRISIAPITRVAREWYDPDVSADRLERALERLMSTPQWPQRPFDGSRRSRAELKSLTSALIGRFVTAARAATLDVAGSGPLVLYDAHLHGPRQTRDEILALKSLAAHYVINSNDRGCTLRRHLELYVALLAHLESTEYRLLETEYTEDFRRAHDDACRMLAVIDQVASLTDVSDRQGDH